MANIIKIKKINDQIVRPTKFIVGGNEDDRPIKGAELFSELYANIFLVARKKSGKTTVLNKIIRACATGDTTVIVFSSTVDKDKEWISIKHYCKMKSIPYIGYTSMKEEDIDVLDTLIKKIQSEAQEEQESDSEEEETPKQHALLLFDSETESEEEEKPKKRKSKYKAPEYIIVLDDISNELKSPILVKLLKMNRHFKTKVIISSQYANDLKPESIRQMDYCLIFKNETIAKLEKLHRDLDLAIPFGIFVEMYKNATSKQYSFLYIDARNEKYRRNFNYEYDVKSFQ